MPEFKIICAGAVWKNKEKYLSKSFLDFFVTLPNRALISKAPRKRGKFTIKMRRHRFPLFSAFNIFQSQLKRAAASRFFQHFSGKIGRDHRPFPLLVLLQFGRNKIAARIKIGVKSRHLLPRSAPSKCCESPSSSHAVCIHLRKMRSNILLLSRSAISFSVK